MKKRLIILLGVVISLLIIVSTVVWASFNAESGKDDNIESAEPVDNVPLTRSFRSADGDDIKLTYVKSNGSDKTNHVYVDSDDNQYNFDSDGNLLGVFYSNKQVTIDSENKLTADDLRSDSELSETRNTSKTEDRIISIAKTHAKELYGTKFERLEFDSIETSSTGSFRVSFAETFGKDGFIKGQTCLVSVKPTGEVIFCSMNMECDSSRFDTKVLDNITRENIEAFAVDNSNNMFSGVTNVDVKNYKLIEKDGKFYIRVQTNVSATSLPSADIIEKYEIDIALSASPMFRVYHYYPLES